MAIFPKATRTSFARLLRKRGYTLPRNRELMFSNVGHGFFLMWEGPDGEPHRAYYTGVAGCPVLVVDQDTVQLTMAEVIGLGDGARDPWRSQKAKKSPADAGQRRQGT